ncbi:uncharacterized protein B0T15DRAFT_296632 [Chaetomium strumarium]|uniref:non-specific serine/threonine protein kinase n=1 Tax=Chaetomium strumarium TaxID=1170767 RepID=A0AAJ0GLL9_9PEZI|nr:hypothetical protein B0T15DRAFT_296632 [Chaetomium strumarium]
MSRTTTTRKYGKSSRKERADELFAQLPGTPIKMTTESPPEGTSRATRHGGVMHTRPDVDVDVQDPVCKLSEQLQATRLDTIAPPAEERNRSMSSRILTEAMRDNGLGEQSEIVEQRSFRGEDEEDKESCHDVVLVWDDVCPAANGIEKIAEASYAEVYRVSNEHGTSVIKVIRLESPIRPQTKAQQRSGLVDEEPHSEEDMRGELSISEWLSDIPGFVVYKERYVVKGKAPKALLETHQAFHRRMKRKDPDRLQFYPSPSRYLDETRFLVVELGDAGTALEDFEVTSISQVWDVFLHTALALARAEALIEFEHRDLHEGNICIRQVRPATSKRPPSSPIQFGFSGLDITILDYGLSRATDPNPARKASEAPEVVAYDLEKDLTLFQSTHAPQCRVYRQMRSYLIHEDRVYLPPNKHVAPYPTSKTTGEPISWRGYYPYTNVLWLAYLYGYLVSHFRGDKKELASFKKETAELRIHLDPGAPRDVLSFPSAGDVVRFAVEAGWVGVGQLVDVWGEEGSPLEEAGNE